MKRLLLWVLTFSTSFGYAQLLSWSPPFPVENNAAQNLLITLDAGKGNQGLLNYSNAADVYVHIGVITNYSTTQADWRHVLTDWAPATPAAYRASFIGNNKWQFTIAGSLRSYFNITDANERILKIALLFRNGNGSRVQRNADDSDMFIPVYGSALAVRIDQPPSQPRYNRVPEPQNWTLGSGFSVTAFANSASTIKLYHNGSLLATAAGAQSLTANSVVSSLGNQQLVAEASDGNATVFDTLNIFVSPPASPVAPLPAGVRDGINYEPGDTSVTLVLRAPGKNKAVVVGEFNNWLQQVSYLMNKTPDGKFFWLRLHPLNPGTEYAYQFVVDDSIRIADPYAEKVLDPWNDRFISATTYPGLRPYPAGQSGMVSLLQTRKPAYNWSLSNFTRPDKRGLIIYELLLRDFLAAHDWKTLSDTLNYLKNLGVNAIEIMPFNEFEGNESWGYNAAFYFAPDKYYGTSNALRAFVDSAHRKGMAVIMDIALNHSFGQSPMVQLYWDAANSRPAANNPWYNPTPRHAFNVGYDFNHESSDTKYFVGRVLEHWVQEYKIDGFRFDLSKGFTQNQTCDNSGNNCNVAAWSNYDASRIAILKGYYDTLQKKSGGAYAILEHFAANSEEMELADYGMLLWGNLNFNYQEAAMGYTASSNFEGALHNSRGWSRPHLVAYAESHDEERLMYKMLNFGNAAGNYSTRDSTTALKRMELVAAFLFTLPGPKMFWQFGELGYDYSINRCTDGSVNNNCRLANKPIRWDYLNEARRRSVYNTYSRLINLRFHPWYQQLFLTGNIERNFTGGFKWLRLTSAGDTSNLVVVGNFDVSPQTGSVVFPNSGTWFDYLNNTTLDATAGTPREFSLQPGEFRVFVNRNVNNIAVTPVVNVPNSGNALEAIVYPNPVKNSLNLRCRLPQSSQLTVTLFSATGQYLGQLYKGFIAQGEKELNLGRPAASAGSYYIKLQTKTASITIPIQIN